MRSEHKTGVAEIDRRLAILAFHKIGSPASGQTRTWFYISEVIFEGFLRSLKKSSWRVIDADTFLYGLDVPDSLPERAVLLTFDDGYRCVRDVALPLLRAFGFPSVCFVSVGFVGSTNRFDAEFEPEESICSWDDIKDLRQAGVSVQSHGVTHRRLSLLNTSELRHEIENSKTVLESRIGHAVKIFSFPYGDNGHNPRITTSVLREAGYTAAFLYGGGPNVIPPGDRFGLQRLAMGPDTNLSALLEST